MNGKILGVMIYEPSWQYYVKFKKYLDELNHPFKERIDFIIDPQLSLGEEEIKEYSAIAFYYHDPLKDLYPDIYRYAKKIESLCIKHNIRMINKPDALSNSKKSTQLIILSENGINVAKAYPFNNKDELSRISSEDYPIFIRSNAGHDTENETVQGPFKSFEDLCARYIENKIEKKHLSGKTAIQWIDTRFPDGHYRLYRAFVCGTEVITGNMYISPEWYIHRKNNITIGEKILAEQKKFLSKEYSPSEKNTFIKVNTILNLDFSAIDYTYTKDGRIVVWEANPHPALPAWTEEEPSKSKITNLIATQYEKILKELATT
jgi:glutathione synthase/RimK-type ligase-like ATP-grasp enzyme